MRQKDVDQLADIFFNEVRLATRDELPGMEAIIGATCAALQYKNPELDYSEIRRVLKLASLRSPLRHPKVESMRRAEAAEAEVERWRKDWQGALDDARRYKSALGEARERAEAAEAEAARLREALGRVEALATTVVKAWDDFGTYEPCSDCLKSGVGLVDFDSDERMDRATDALRAVLASVGVSGSADDRQARADNRNGTHDAMERVGHLSHPFAPAASSVDDRPGCHADRDGDCSWGGCPQLRDGEPKATGRHCPLDTWDDER